MFGMGLPTKTSGHSLVSLGILERSAAKAHAAFVASGWREIGYGYHGTVHAHADHPDVVVRLARKADGFGDYAALLRKGFSGSNGPHALRISRMVGSDFTPWWAVISRDHGQCAA